MVGLTIGDTIEHIINELGDDSITINTTNDIISTGAELIKDDERYTVVIKGDITGDGKINSGDLLFMRKHLLEEQLLEGAFKEAGLIESKTKINSLDLLRLRQFLLGDYEIH